MNQEREEMIQRHKKRTARLFMQGMLASGDNRAPAKIAEDAIKHADAFEREWKKHVQEKNNERKKS